MCVCVCARVCVCVFVCVMVQPHAHYSNSKVLEERGKGINALGLEVFGWFGILFEITTVAYGRGKERQ